MGSPCNQPRPPHIVQHHANMAETLRILSVTLLLADLSLGKLLLPTWKDQAIQDDYDVLKYPPARSPGFGFWTKNGVVNSTGRDYTAHVAVLSGGFPYTFSLQLPTGGCCHVSLTSDTARLHNCTYATNAGFFNTHTGCCVGNLITNGTPIQLPASNRANFGMTNGSFLTGYLTNKTVHNGGLGLVELISAAGWLVRRGKPYVNESMKIEDLPESFVTEKAPRTVIALDTNGTLSLIQVDGEEDVKAGLDLYEMTEILVEMGTWQALNLDGGGSSVSVYKGKVISKPTCLDTHFICQRPVTSITCISNV